MQKGKKIPLHAMPRIFNCFLVRIYSTIPHNKLAQAEAIAHNSAQRNSDWKP